MAVVSAALLLGASAFMGAQMRSVSFEDQAALRSAIERIDRDDALVDQDVVLHRAGKTGPMTAGREALDRIHKERQRLLALMGAVPSDTRSDLVANLEQHAEATTKKRSMLGQLETENDTLREQLRGFPSACRGTAELCDELRRNGGPSIARQITDLSLLVLMSDRIGGDQQRPDLVTICESLRSDQTNRALPTALQAQIKSIADRAIDVQTRQRRLDEIVAEILALPTKPVLERVARRLSEVYDGLLLQSEAYRRIAYGCCLLLILYSAFVMWRLHRASRQLREANVNLEGRIQERTEALQRTNAELRVEIEERQRAEQHANAASRSKSEFLANMSHEIRTPMTAILGYAEMLLEEGQSQADRLDRIRTIQRNGDHLLGVINDILDISKIEAGRMTIERVNCSVRDLVEEVATMMRVRAQEKGLSFDVEYRTPLPALAKTDPTRIRQILVNLAGNALKFTDTGAVKIVAEMGRSLGVGKREMLIHVADTGIGMSEEQVARLFQPFVQADTSTTRRYGGTGLGLTISKRLAQMLGGDVTVESHPGQGSMFTLQIALQAPDPVVKQLGTGNGLSVIGGPGTLRGRILLAEDGPDNQRLIVHILKKAGASEVVIAPNGRIACDAVLAAQRDGTTFDLVLMDMQMPELDGYSAAGELRRQGFKGPILALTAHALQGDREKCIAAGCDDFATKPIDKKRLIEQAATLVARGPAG